MHGTITLVQESRFQVTDESGAAHLFVLGRNASAEPAQLVPLAARQARISVTYEQAENVLARLARRIVVDESAS